MQTGHVPFLPWQTSEPPGWQVASALPSHGLCGDKAKLSSLNHPNAMTRQEEGIP